jgi:prepilin-type N-terminal cleavage/methylation domain-containing protein
VRVSSRVSVRPAVAEHAAHALLPRGYRDGCMLRKIVSKTGMTLPEMMVTVALGGILAALVIPSMRRARNVSIRLGCLENQRIIYNAVIMYEQDTGKTLEPIKQGGGLIRQALMRAGYVKNMGAFRCPGDTPYTSDSYTLLYTSGTFSNTWCWKYRWSHWLP